MNPYLPETELRRLRKEKEIEPTFIAEKCDTNRTRYYEIEANESPATDREKRNIALALGVTPESLWDGIWLKVRIPMLSTSREPKPPDRLIRRLTTKKSRKSQESSNKPATLAAYASKEFLSLSSKEYLQAMHDSLSRAATFADNAYFTQPETARRLAGDIGVTLQLYLANGEPRSLINDSILASYHFVCSPFFAKTVIDRKTWVHQVMTSYLGRTR